ncbi:MAG TPA: response regulator transcription factor [Chloroflexia bacterium]|nr:response regulator transcription factor [Chloroflexia bacterium]
MPGPLEPEVNRHGTEAAGTIAPAYSENTQRIRILMADDHSLMRDGISYILQTQPDFEVVGGASDGLEVIEQVRALKPHVILMDLQMPNLNGVEAIRRLLAENDQLKIIILTTFNTDEYIYEGIRAGAHGYLLKDVPKEELFKAIRLVYQGQSLAQPVITARIFKLLARGGANSGEQPALTERELEVLKLMAQGDRNKEIAQKLAVSENTIKTYVAAVLQKLNVTDRTQAAIYAVQKGLVRLEE